MGKYPVDKFEVQREKRALEALMPALRIIKKTGVERDFKGACPRMTKKGARGIL